MINGNGFSADDIPALRSRWRRWFRLLSLPFNRQKRKQRSATRKNREAVDQWWNQMKHADRPARPAKRDIWLG